MRRNPRATVLVGVALAVTVTALAQTPAPKVKPTATSSALAKYIPKDGLFAYVEYQGTEVHKDAWAKTAANKILNDTATGAMLEEIIVQTIDTSVPANLPVKPTGAEIAAMLKHIAKYGMVVGTNVSSAGKLTNTVVYPNAMRDDASRKTFAPMIRVATKGGKPEVVTKPGNRTVASVPQPAPQSTLYFWKENNADLVITEDVDAVIAALDGKGGTALDASVRKSLFTEEGGAEPLGGLVIDLSSVPAGAAQMTTFLTHAGIDSKAIKSIEYRLGLREENLVHDFRIVAPSPRSGNLAFLDGPKIDLKTLPPVPEDVTEFSAFALDPAKLYGQVVTALKAAKPDSEASITSLETIVKGKSKMRLREDVLGRLGPKFLVYKSSAKAKTASSGGVGSLLGMLGGGAVQVPKAAMFVEIKDPKAVTAMLDQLMIVANKELRTRMAVAPPPGEGDASGARPGAAKAKTAAPGSTPEFKVTINNPKTYALNLPPALAALTNLKLTIVVGKKYLVVATMPDVAKEAITAESKGTSSGAKGLSKDASKAIQDMPTGLIMVSVSDPRATLPEAMSKLPATLSTSVSSLTAATPPAGTSTPPATAPPGNPQQGDQPAFAAGGRGRPGAGQRAPQQGPVAAPGGGGTTPAPAGGEAQATGAPPAASAGSAFKISIDPSKVPTADSLRPHIGLETTAIAVDDQGIRFLVRHSFPDLGTWAGLPSMIKTAMTSGFRGAMPVNNGNQPGQQSATPPKPPGGGGAQVN